MTPPEYMLGFVQRDGNMHNDRRYGVQKLTIVHCLAGRTWA